MTTTPAPPAPAVAPPPAPAPEAKTRSPLWDTVLTTFLAFVLALAIGGVLIAVSDPDVIEAATSAPTPSSRPSVR